MSFRGPRRARFALLWLALCRPASSALPFPLRSCRGAECAHRALPEGSLLLNQPYLKVELSERSAAASNATACANATAAEFVVDFSCSHVWSHEPFHRLIDCFLPNYNLVEQALALPGATLLVPHYLWPLLEPLLPETLRLGVAHYPKPGGCVWVAPTSTIFYERRAVGEDLVASAARLRARAWEAAGVAPSRRTFLYIDRVAPYTRRIGAGAMDALRSRLHADTPFVTYNGSEPFLDSVRLFSQASVISSSTAVARRMFCSLRRARR